MNEIFRLKPVVSYTTRPKRFKETDGIEHYFLDKKQKRIMDLKIKLGIEKMVAYTKINDYEYYATLKELKKKNLYIIDPKGRDSLFNRLNTLKHDDLHIATIYIGADEETRKHRATKLRGDEVETYYKRNMSEDEQFSEFENMYNIDTRLKSDLIEPGLFFIYNGINTPISEGINDMIRYIKGIVYNMDLILVMGRTGSGKDTIVKGAINYFRYNDYYI